MPTDALQSIRLLIWLISSMGVVMGVLSGVLGFLIVRFIKRNDQSHAAVLKDFSGTREHARATADEMKKAALHMQKTANQIHSTQLSFQSKVNEELLTINKSTQFIKTDLNECQRRIGRIRGDMSGLTQTMKKQQENLTLGVDAIRSQRIELNELKSKVLKLSKEEEE